MRSLMAPKGRQLKRLLNCSHILQSKKTTKALLGHLGGAFVVYIHSSNITLQSTNLLTLSAINPHSLMIPKVRFCMTELKIMARNV